MAIYLLLILYVLVVPLVVKQCYQDPDKRIQKESFWCVLGVYLVLALKKYTVGIDIPGYREQYILSASKAWNDFDYVYFEDGYIFFQKIFSKIGIPFQLYSAIVYLIICFGLYLFIKRFSRDPALSVLFYICYQFFLFSATGIRQALASGLCMIAIVLLEPGKITKKTRGYFFGILLLLGAITIHRSSFIFLFSPLLIWLNSKKGKVNYLIYYFLIPVAYAMRPLCLAIINFLFGGDGTAEFSLGLNYAFLILLSIFVIYARYVDSSKHPVFESNGETMRKNQLLAIRMSLVTLPIYLALSETGYLRGVMYYTVFYIISVPNAVACFNARNKTVMKLALILFLIIFFFFDALLPATFRICPYQFFWQ